MDTFAGDLNTWRTLNAIRGFAGVICWILCSLCLDKTRYWSIVDRKLDHPKYSSKEELAMPWKSWWSFSINVNEIRSKKSLIITKKHISHFYSWFQYHIKAQSHNPMEYIIIIIIGVRNSPLILISFGRHKTLIRSSILVIHMIQVKSSRKEIVIR